MAVEVQNLVDDPRLLLGVLEVAGGSVDVSSENLQALCADKSNEICSAGYSIPEDKRSAVRKLLKIAKFSPSGRNRPAHELLVRDMIERGEFHHINNVVDVNNLVSLESLLPISIFDVDKLDGGVAVRIAVEGEGYVFNQSGQYMDVKRSIICATGDPNRPVGSPVKDSMETKIFEGASRYLGIIYGTTDGWTRDGLLQHTRRMADLLASETGGEVVQAMVV